MLVPDLFWHELRVLIVAERTGRIAVGTMNNHMKDIRALNTETDPGQDDEAVSALARRHGLSGYDAAYLETAIRRQAKLATLDKRQAKLATLDKKLARAAASEGVLDG